MGRINWIIPDYNTKIIYSEANVIVPVKFLHRGLKMSGCEKTRSDKCINILFLFF